MLTYNNAYIMQKQDKYKAMIDNNGNKKTLKRFGIISSLIFSVIIAFSVIWIQITDYSNLVLVQVINIIILSSGLIGLGYCILILRTFDNKTDKVIAEKYKEILDKEAKEDNKKDETFIIA